MQFRITYFAHDQKYAETIIVSGTRAVHALIDYANKWNDKIFLIEERAARTRTWKPSNITQEN